MTPADRYRVKAAELMARARLDTNPMLRVECENLALAYLRLADQADRNAQTEAGSQLQASQLQASQIQAISGSPSGHGTAQPSRQQQQQQQQSQPKQEPEKD